MTEQKQAAKWLRDLPNQLTLFRIAVVPVLLVLYPLEVKGLELFCAFLFMAAALTDWLDGFIARRFHLESKLGAILDPIADKMLTTCALVLLASSQVLWAWAAGLLLCRDMAISGMRLIAYQQGFSIEVSSFGKWKTFFVDLAIVCLMVNRPLFGWPWQEVGMIALWGALALSLYSWWLYSKDFWRSL